MSTRFLSTSIWCSVAFLVFFIFAPALSSAQVDGRRAEAEVSGAENLPGQNIDTSSLKLDIRNVKTQRNIRLEPFGESEKSSLPPAEKDSPLRIGAERNMPSPYSQKVDLASLEWTRLETGGQAAILTVTSPGAEAVRMGLSVKEMAEDIEIRFFGMEAPQKVFGPYTVEKLIQKDIQVEKSSKGYITQKQLFWSPVIEGDTVGMEIYLPEGRQLNELSFSIPQIAHIWLSVLKSTPKRLADIGHSGTCEVDIACNTQGWGSTGNSVVKLLWTDPPYTYLCTGTLIADNVSGTSIPYLLTANHCITYQSEASNLNTYWFFQRSSCGGPDPTTVTQLTGGGNLLTRGVTTDHSLVQLNDTPPPGAVYSGWYSGTIVPGTDVTGIHHPQGDLKKISLGDFNAYDWYLGTPGGTQDHSRITWMNGTTEGGSSGSGIWYRTGGSDYLVGTLHGGYASCSAPSEPDYYGRFDMTYDYLYQWLDPDLIPQLQNDVPVTNISELEGGNHSYKITVPPGAETLTVTTTGGTGDVDLVVNFGSPASPFRSAGYDCLSDNYGNDDSCTIDNPDPGEWHIMLYAYDPFSGVTLTATYLSPINLTSGGAAVRETTGTHQPTKVGYAKLTMISGTSPYATAVFRYKKNNVTITEAGVPASPPTTEAKIFIDYREGVDAVPAHGEVGQVDINTGIVVVNTGASTANVNYTLRNIAGGILTSGTGTIEAAHHFARFIDQFGEVASGFTLPANFASAVQFGVLDISSDQPLSIVALRMTTNQRNDILFTTTPVADLTDTLGYDPVYFPQFADGGGYTSSLILLNTSGATETGTLQILDNDGLPLVVNQVGGTADSSFAYSIPPNGVYLLRTDGFPAVTNVGWVRLIPSGSTPTPIGSGVFGYVDDNVLVSESGVPAAGSSTHARVYVDLTNNHNVGLAIANLDSTIANITINAFQMNGSTGVGTSAGPLELPGDGHAARFANQLINGLPAGFTGVLEISSPTPFTALTLRSLDNERNDFLMTTFPIADADQPAPSPIVFPQIADGDGYVSEFILLSAGDPSSSNLDYYDESGGPF